MKATAVIDLRSLTQTLGWRATFPTAILSYANDTVGGADENGRGKTKLLHHSGHLVLADYC